MNKEQCPFCGADAELIKSAFGDSDIKKKDSFGFYRYQCSNDNCPEKPSTHEFCDYVHNKTGPKKALEAWNKKEYVPNMEDAFASVGVQVVDKDGNFRPLNEIFEQLSDVWCNLDKYNKGEINMLPSQFEAVSETKYEIKKGNVVNSLQLGIGVIGKVSQEWFEVHFETTGCGFRYDKNKLYNKEFNDSLVIDSSAIQSGDKVAFRNDIIYSGEWTNMRPARQEYFKKFFNKIGTVEYLKVCRIRNSQKTDNRFVCAMVKELGEYMIPIVFLKKIDDIAEITPVKKGYIVKIVDNFYNSDYFYTQEPKVKRIICELWRYGKFYVRSVDSGGLIKSVIYEHAIPAQLVEIVSPIKKAFTPEQVAEAEAIIGKIVVNCMSFGDRLVFVERDKETIVVAIFGKDNRDDLTGVAKCAEHHEYNETILKMIALCKATKAEIPGWVYNV